MTFRFLHTSDLHLGKAFGNYPEAIRHRLREARHGSIAQLAQAARSGGAGVVLLAGDTFDAETPAPDTLRHALRAMAAEADLTWVLLPGNHDSLAASELWRRIAAQVPSNLRAVTDTVPIEVASGAWLLPSPCTARRPGRDLTESMSQATPEGSLRIGLGHGAVTDFSAEEGAAGIIPPDRARQSGLDYLALGDWHGCLEITPQTWYSGTPELDGFKHGGRGTALIVDLASKGRADVARVPVGKFSWSDVALSLLPGDLAEALLQPLLPAIAGRREALVRVTARGRLGLSALGEFRSVLEQLAPDFGWFAFDLSGIAVDTSAADLDLIDRGGALRRAAEALQADAINPAFAAGERDLAAAALSRLFSIAQEVQA